MFLVDLNEISTIITTVYSSEHCPKSFYLDSHSILGINHFTDDKMSSEII